MSERPGPGHEASPLEFTGERFTPECVREMFYEHWHRYAWARSAVAGLKVLDAACGEGYGSALLAGAAARVDGVDLSEQAVAHARQHYRAENLAFHCADCLELPFADDHFDAIVSFETLEHLAEHDRLLAEFRRVLKDDGFLLLSSPDRRTYSDESGFDNEFHVRELYRDELEALLDRHFGSWKLWGQKLLFQSALWSLDRPPSRPAEHLLADAAGAVEKRSDPGPAPLYFLVAAAASAECLPPLAELSLFGDRAESVYTHYNEEVARHIRAGELLAERDEEIRQLRARLEARSGEPSDRDESAGGTGDAPQKNAPARSPAARIWGRLTGRR